MIKHKPYKHQKAMPKQKPCNSIKYKRRLVKRLDKTALPPSQRAERG
ncbi:hypothetical protein Hc94105_0954 [Helicobacter cinaedi]|nr:hypothetical protein [Helicobacter cinaedi]BDB66753.1 hypothetical protein Hc94105_0954 [Helicobacter cinaedi]